MITSSILPIGKDGHCAVHVIPSNPKQLRSAPPGETKIEWPAKRIERGGQAQLTYGVVCAIDQTIWRQGPLNTD
jgi:hypothetical protein